MDLLCSEPGPSSSPRLDTIFEDKEPTESNSSSSSQSVKLIDSIELSSSPLSLLSDASSGYESATTITTTTTTSNECRALEANWNGYQVDSVTSGHIDYRMLEDVRIPRQLLAIEDQYVPWSVDDRVYRCDEYEADEKARRILTEWMLEVCEELRCEEAVLPLAVNYLDRYLLTAPDTRKGQLQLVAVVCLLIASKLRQCTMLDPLYLSYATECSVAVKDMLAWEKLILSKLKWDVSSVIATDYLDHILVIVMELFELNSAQVSGGNSGGGGGSSASQCTQASWAPKQTSRKRISPDDDDNTEDDYDDTCGLSPKRIKLTDERMDECGLTFTNQSLEETIRRHANTFITLCSAELQFICVKPSLMATACVATAIRGIFANKLSTSGSKQPLYDERFDHDDDDDDDNNIEQQTFYDNLYRKFLYSIEKQIGIDSMQIEFYVQQIEQLFAIQTTNLTKSECVPHKQQQHRPEPHSSEHSTRSSSSSTNPAPNSVQSNNSANKHYIHTMSTTTSYASMSSAKQLLLSGTTTNHYHPHHHYRSHRHHHRHHHHLYHYIPASLHDYHPVPSLTDNTNMAPSLSSTSSFDQSIKQTKSIATTTASMPEMFFTTYHQNEDRENIPIMIMSQEEEADQENVPPSSPPSTSTATTTIFDGYVSLFATDEHLPEDDEDEGLCDF